MIPESAPTISAQLTPLDPTGEPTTPQITLEDIVGQAVIGQIALTPDGTAVAYVLGAASQVEKYATARIYIAELPGGEAHPFTRSSGFDGAPAWSPGGRILAFVSDRQERGTAALYLIPRSGGEAERLGQHDGEVRTPQWSPDGARIAFLLAEPLLDDPDGLRQGSAALLPAGAHRRQTLWCTDVDGSNATPLSAADSHVWAFAWSPGSDQIAAIIAHTSEANTLYAGARVVLYSLSGDAPVGEVGPASIGVHEPLLVWSRDGQTLFSLGAPADRFPETYLQAYAARPDAGAPRNLLGDLSGTLAWIGRPDLVEELIGLVREGVRSYVVCISADGERAEPLVSWSDLDVVSSIAARRDGRMLVGTVGTGSTLPDLWLWHAGTEIRRISDSNPWLVPGALGPQQPIRWTSSDGQEIEGLLILPAGEQPATGYPLVVQIHGGPMGLWLDSCQLSWHDWGQWLALHGLAVLLPNPRGSSGRGNTFVHANVADIGGGDLHDVLTGVDWLVAEGLADPERLGIGGWSYGGTLTSWAITQTQRFRCAVVGAGCVNWVSWTGASDIRLFGHWLFDRDLARDGEEHWRRSAIRHIGNVRTPTLIVHGEEDARVPVGQGRELYTALRHLGVPVELVVYPQEGHLIKRRAHQRDLLERITNWFTQYLLDAATSPEIKEL